MIIAIISFPVVYSTYCTIVLITHIFFQLHVCDTFTSLSLMVQNLLWGTEEHLIRGLNIMLVLFNVIFYTNNEFLQYMCVKKTSLKYISLYYLIWFQGKTVLYNYYQLLIINVSYIFQTKNWYNNPLSKYITASLSTRLNIDHK